MGSGADTAATALQRMRPPSVCHASSHRRCCCSQCRCCRATGDRAQLKVGRYRHCFIIVHHACRNRGIALVDASHHTGTSSKCEHTMRSVQRLPWLAAFAAAARRSERAADPALAASRSPHKSQAGQPLTPLMAAVCGCVVERCKERGHSG